MAAEASPQTGQLLLSGWKDEHGILKLMRRDISRDVVFGITVGRDNGRPNQYGGQSHNMAR